MSYTLFDMCFTTFLGFFLGMVTIIILHAVNDYRANMRMFEEFGRNHEEALRRVQELIGA